MYLATLNLTKPAADVEPLNKSHGEWVRRHISEGTFLFAGSKNAGNGGVILVKSIDEAQLEAILAEDSYITGKVGDYQTVAFTTRLTQDWLEGLKAL